MLIKSGQHFRGKIHFGSESPIPNMTPFSNRNRKMKIMLFIKGREAFQVRGLYCGSNFIVPYFKGPSGEVRCALFSGIDSHCYTCNGCLGR